MSTWPGQSCEVHLGRGRGSKLMRNSCLSRAAAWKAEHQLADSLHATRIAGPTWLPLTV